MIDELEMQLEEKTNETTRLASQLKPLVALPAQLDLACQQYETSAAELAAVQAQLASLRDAHAQVERDCCLMYGHFQTAIHFSRVNFSLLADNN